jgi:hypothetical protein
MNQNQLDNTTTPRSVDQQQACSPSDFADGDLAAVRYRDNWDGQGDICETIAQWRGGEWWPHDGGERLLKYEGSEILQVWPLKNETALRWHEANTEVTCSSPESEAATKEKL